MPYRPRKQPEVSSSEQAASRHDQARAEREQGERWGDESVLGPGAKRREVSLQRVTWGPGAWGISMRVRIETVQPHTKVNPPHLRLERV